MTMHIVYRDRDEFLRLQREMAGAEDDEDLFRQIEQQQHELTTANAALQKAEADAIEQSLSR